VSGFSAYEKAAAPSTRHPRDNARVIVPVASTSTINGFSVSIN